MDHPRSALRLFLFLSAACGTTVFGTTVASAANPVFYNDQTTFSGQLTASVIDTYSNPAYIFFQGDAAMSAVLGETDYQSTGFNNINIVSGGAYCAGCNGSFRLTFTSTSVGTAQGVHGVGFKVQIHDQIVPYYAYITYADNTTQNVALPPAGNFWGVTAPERITSIHLGLSNAGTTQNGSFAIDDLIIGSISCSTNSDCPQDSNPCTTAVCNAGTCVQSNNSASCDDGNACTQTDVCQGGACVGSNPVSCTAQDQCHVAGTCNPADGICSNPNKVDGTACNDGDACSQTDVCAQGVCTGFNAVTCSAQDACHVAGTCDPGTGSCSNPPAADGTACNDNNSCTQTDACVAGSCVGGNSVICAASDQCHLAGSCDPFTGQCANPAAPDGVVCNDGNGCTQTDLCVGGLCLGANPVQCSAQDDCHDAGTCDPSTGQCTNPTKPDDTDCSDGDVCTQNDKCQAGTCTAGPAIVCEDNNVCTADSCDPSTGCVNAPVPDDSPCDDSNACNVGDRCLAGVCEATGGLDCDDNNPCTADSCDTNGGCNHIALADGSACSDSNACTANDVCQAGQCTGMVLDCDDNNACTSDACDAATGCTHAAQQDGTTCSDGNACTSNDSCQAGACVGSGVTCSPEECKQSSGCNASSGQCEFSNAPDGTACSGGSCSNGACVPSGTGGSAGAAGDGGSGGAGGSGAGGSGSGGSAGAGASSSGSSATSAAVEGGGCGCRVAPTEDSGSSWSVSAGLAALGAVLMGARRRQRKHSA